jgi:alpha-D-ribose 1-methylphosphonate 5-triphosphate synthase subunit PhnH
VLTAQAIESAPRGEEMQPEAGATLYLHVDEKTPRTRARLSGPGVRGSLDVSLPLSRDALNARARACASFPRGVDIVAIDRDATVTALPRTTRVEVC